MAFCLGMRSASVRFCAKDETSTPEPVPKEVMIFCALARLAAWVVAFEDALAAANELGVVVAVFEPVELMLVAIDVERVVSNLVSVYVSET